MLIVFIFGICLVQIVLYYLKVRLIPKLPDFIIMDILILSNLLVFPTIFISILLPMDVTCGLPAMGVTLGFWIFGTIAAVVIHFGREKIMTFLSEEWLN